MSTEVLVEQPDADEGSVGVVQTQFVTLFDSSRPLKLQSGTELDRIRVAYETYGELSEQKDNAIYVCHALTGDAHAAGKHHADDRKSGWWEGFLGPGKAIDTNRYFVICANVIGGCQGTLGPGSVNPDSNERYCRSFPFITVGDMVSVHSELVRHLGITQLLTVIGGSLGGMQVLDWAVRFPDQLHTAIVLASAANLSAQGIAFNAVGRRAIITDPNFLDGNYYESDGPRFGLALARMLAHITYLSEDSIEMKFGRRLQHSDRFAYDLLQDTEFQIESYLHYQGKRFVERFDANSYLYLTRAMDYFDLSEGHGSLDEALKHTLARFLIVSYNTDWLFPTNQSKAIVRSLIKQRKEVSYIELDSPYGHDSFLIELEQLAALVAPFLEHAQAESRDPQQNTRPTSGEDS